MCARFRTVRWMLFIGSALALVLAGCSDQQQVTTQGGTQISVINHYFASISVPAKQIGQATAKCKPGEEVVSGGFGTVGTDDSDQVVYPVNKTVVVASYPSDTASWTVVLLNREDKNITLSAHVQCTSLKGSVIRTVDGTTDSDALIALCPSNTQLIGGGFRVGQVKNLLDVVAVIASVPVLQAKSWTTVIHEAQGSSARSNPVTAYAVCTSANFRSSQGNVQEVAAAVGNSNKESVDGSGTAGCAAGQLLLAAGFRLNDNSGYLAPFLFFSDYSTSPLVWHFRFRALIVTDVEGQRNSPGGTGHMYPVCGTVHI